MIVAITGANGFIGRRLTETYVALGAEVRTLSSGRRSKAPIGGVSEFVADLAKAQSADLMPFVAGADLILHCAAELSDPSRMKDVNVRGTRVLLDAAVRSGVTKWIQLSSTGAYGPRSSGVVTEDDPERPRGLYETTKVQADDIVRSAVARGEIDAVVIRPSNVFGSSMSNQSLFQLVRMVDRGLFVFLGAPGASANYVHVRNVVHAIQLCERAPAGRVYNVSDWCTIEEFVANVANALGRPTPRLRLPEGIARAATAALGWMPGFPLTPSRIDALVARVRYSTERIQNELGFTPMMPVQEGVRELVRGMKHNHAA